MWVGMETYYKPQDLGKFEEIGQDAPELAKKFFDYYNAVFADGELTRVKTIDITGGAPELHPRLLPFLKALAPCATV